MAAQSITQPAANTSNDINASTSTQDEDVEMKDAPKTDVEMADVEKQEQEQTPLPPQSEPQPQLQPQPQPQPDNKDPPDNLTNDAALQLSPVPSCAAPKSEENENSSKMEQDEVIVAATNGNATSTQQKHQCRENKHSEMDDSVLNERVANEEEIVGEKQRLCKLEKNDNDISAILKMLVDYKVTDWEHNMFTRGSYSYLPRGSLYNHCKSLQKYDGNGIFFCGEATSVEGFECVDGAHETGFSVAKQVHRQLQQSLIEQEMHPKVRRK
mmetsp:Transcript_15160/g.23779  ORF Transcript_15160/g.23779 Transcript_15160/m.23779 type:complete len:269 (+) Transcript_15160:1-807(+)